MNPDIVSETFQPRCEASGSVGLVMPDRSIGTRMPRGTLMDVKVTGTIHALQGKSGERRTANAAGRAQEVHMDITTILVIVLIVILLGGGGFYGRGRWY
ncbi:hypothetical protein B5V02_37690 [Mesorhizobium kowhaii]|uniref:Uncharacterized protein n=2 Tax=Mesorhizobium kowhaii TaxID=1300272 RepID=A0A2W7CGW9_9HYPH|nr:hypothetical protein B5V02_37690 [Mesorhizobium kowhaii]